MLKLMALLKPQYQVVSPPVQGHDDQQDGNERGENDWTSDEDTDDEEEESYPAEQIPEGLYPRDGFDFYPKRFVKLATACIQFNPKQQPSPKQLCMSVRNIATRYTSRESHSVPYRKSTRKHLLYIIESTDTFHSSEFQEIPADQLLRIEPDKHSQWLA